MTWLLFLLIVHFVLAFDVPTNVIVLLTPVPYLDPTLLSYLNIISKSPFLSPLGLRQSYLIGRELRQKYTEQFQMPPNQSHIYTDYSSVKSQTALGVLRGLFLAGSGSTIDNLSIQKRSIPPSKSFNFSNFSEPMRDASLPYYSRLWPVHSLVSGHDTLFNADTECHNAQKIIQKFSQKNSCSRSQAASKACKELYQICPLSGQNNHNTCKCLDFYKSAQRHQIKLSGEISKENARLIERICDECYESILNEDVAKLLTERLFADFLVHFNTSDLTVYVVSELQIKAIMYALTSEFFTDMPKYGSMMLLERKVSEQHADYIELSFNKRPIKVLGEKTVNYTRFVEWLKERKLENYEITCDATPINNEESKGYITYIALGIAIGTAVLIFMTVIMVLHYKHNVGDERLIVEPDEPRSIVVQEEEKNEENEATRINNSKVNSNINPFLQDEEKKYEEAESVMINKQNEDQYNKNGIKEELY